MTWFYSSKLDTRRRFDSIASRLFDFRRFLPGNRSNKSMFVGNSQFEPYNKSHACFVFANNGRNRPKIVRQKLFDFSASVGETGTCLQKLVR